MAKKEEQEPEKKPAKAPKPLDVTLAPGQTLTIHLVAEGEELARWFAQASEYDAEEVARGDAPKKASILVYQVSHEEPAPVTDPDPISDHRHMTRTK